MSQAVDDHTQQQLGTTQNTDQITKKSKKKNRSKGKSTKFSFSDWSSQEHIAFVNAICQCNQLDFDAIAAMVLTKSAGQCRSHYYTMKSMLNCTDEKLQDCFRQYKENAYKQPLDLQEWSQSLKLKNGNQSNQNQNPQPIDFDIEYQTLSEALDYDPFESQHSLSNSNDQVLNPNSIRMDTEDTEARQEQFGIFTVIKTLDFEDKQGKRS